jgi:hypothetical protein
MDTAQGALIAQLSQPGSQSKKYRMTVIGIASVLFVLVIMAVLSFVNATAAKELAALATVVATAIGVMVGAYTGGQSAVDAKTAAAIASAPSG